MAVKKQGGSKASPPKSKQNKSQNKSKNKKQSTQSGGLRTTPTQYGSTSPDYVSQEGDPDYLRSYSEEQIGMLGGRDAIFERVAARDSAAYGGEFDPAFPEPDIGETPFFDPPDTTSNQDSTISIDDPIDMNEGPTTAPTTYGAPTTSSFGVSEQSKKNTLLPAPTKKKRKIGQQVQKGGLTKRISKTTGTTRGEARGVMKKVRRQTRRGNTAGARRTLTRALSGGPRGGVAGSRSRTTKARATSRKVVSRIQTRQRAPEPVRRPKTATPAKRRKK